jgi:hypothetical protein
MNYYALSASMLALALPVSAFVPASITSSPLTGATKLQMAFPTDKPSNMFDGPTPLVKERDACGVGFIANTKSGGKLLSLRKVLDTLLGSQIVVAL